MDQCWNSKLGMYLRGAGERWPLMMLRIRCGRARWLGAASRCARAFALGPQSAVLSECRVTSGPVAKVPE